MMMIGSDDRGRVKIVLYGITSKMADVALASLLLAAPHIHTHTRIHIHIYMYISIYIHILCLFACSFLTSSLLFFSDYS